MSRYSTYLEFTLRDFTLLCVFAPAVIGRDTIE